MRFSKNGTSSYGILPILESFIEIMFLTDQYDVYRTDEDVLIGRLESAKYLIKKGACRGQRKLIYMNISYLMAVVGAQKGMLKLLSKALDLLGDVPTRQSFLDSLLCIMYIRRFARAWATDSNLVFCMRYIFDLCDSFRVSGWMRL
jgi:hypothetical protein